MVNLHGWQLGCAKMGLFSLQIHYTHSLIPRLLLSFSILQVPKHIMYVSHWMNSRV